MSSVQLEIKANPKIPDIMSGDTVKVSVKIVESGKERIQSFQGVVIKIKRGGVNSSFTVRRVTYGVGVERTFPFFAPVVEKVEVVRHGQVRRAKLYYLRGRSGKNSRIKEKRLAAVAPELVAAPAEPIEVMQVAPEAAVPAPATQAPPAAEEKK
jgi:large subunit ribosomal protein L19